MKRLEHEARKFELWIINYENLHDSYHEGISGVN